MSEQILERMRKASAAQQQESEHASRLFLSKPVPRRKTRGDIGLELEIEGEGLPNYIEWAGEETGHSWRADEDGSLRGENFEYVTSGAIRMAEVEPALTALFGAFESNQTRLNLSNRCSTHVHVNVSMLTPKVISSYIALWGIVEEAATNWCGHTRVSNPFCLRMIDSTGSLDMWGLYLEGRMDRERSRGLKYNSLNLLPLWEQGSVEFRPLRGADDIQTVLKWARFLWALREEARTTFCNPMTIAQQVSANGALGLVQNIVAKHGLADFWKEVEEHPDNRQLPAMLRRGFLVVQPLIFDGKWNLTPDKEEDGDFPETAQEKLDREYRAVELERQREFREQAAAAPPPLVLNEAFVGGDPVPHDPVGAIERLGRAGRPVEAPQWGQVEDVPADWAVAPAPRNRGRAIPVGQPVRIEELNEVAVDPDFD